MAVGSLGLAGAVTEPQPPLEFRVQGQAKCLLHASKKDTYEDLIHRAVLAATGSSNGRDFRRLALPLV